MSKRTRYQIAGTRSDTANAADDFGYPGGVSYGTPIPAPAPNHPIVGRPEETLVQLLKRLRTVRDSGEFKQQGCHTFREWCMKQFGERTGGVVDDHL